MKRSLSVFKRVRRPNFVSHRLFYYVRPQWQSIYSTHRGFCNKRIIGNGLSGSGDVKQVPQLDTIDSGLDTAGAGGQLSGGISGYARSVIGYLLICGVVGTAFIFYHKEQQLKTQQNKLTEVKFCMEI